MESLSNEITKARYTNYFILFSDGKGNRIIEFFDGKYNNKSLNKSITFLVFGYMVASILLGTYIIDLKGVN